MRFSSTRAILVQFALLLLLGAVAATQRHRQVATCNLNIVGSSEGVTPVLHKGSFLPSAAAAPPSTVLSRISLHCTSSDGQPIPVGFNSSIITSAMQQTSFTGVRLVPADSATVREACGVPWSEKGAPEPMFPLLYFCGDLHIDFISFSVVGVHLLDHSTLQQRSHLVLLGGAATGSVTATLEAPQVVNNTARSALMIAGSSAVNISRMHCAGNLGFIGACVVATGTAAVRVQQSTFIKCTAHVGPGVTALQEARLQISGSSFTSCKAGDSGGAVSLRHFGTIEVDHSSFVGNSGGQHGGAVDIYCSQHHSCRAQIVNSMFQDNQAQKGGAVDAEDAVVTVYGSRFSHCIAALTGGGLRARNAVLAIHNSTVVNCSVTGSGHGGAVAAYRNSDLLVGSSSLVHNSAAFGGAIYASAIYDGHRCTVHVENSTLSENVAVLARFVTSYARYRDGGQGGAVFGYMADISIVDSAVLSNTARSYGGGVSVKHRASLVLNNTRVESNVAHDLHAVGVGGGLAVADASARVHGCSISNNSAWESGGGMWVAKSNLSVDGSSLSHNNASGPVGKGGMLHVLLNATIPVVVELHSSSIENNGAPIGGAVYAFVESNKTQPQQNNRLVVNSSIDRSRAYTGQDLFVSGVLDLDLSGSNVNLGSKTVIRKSMCMLGDTVAAAGDGCVMCPLGTFSLDADHRQPCQECPDHASCSGGAVVMADPGFFHSNDKTGMCNLNLSTVIRCPNPQACQHKPSDVEPQHPYYSFMQPSAPRMQDSIQDDLWHNYNTRICTAGYRGLLCGNCREGFGQTDAFSCSTCPGINADGTGQVDQEGIFMLLAICALVSAAVVWATISMHVLDNSSPTAVGRDTSNLKGGGMRQKHTAFHIPPDELHLTDVIKALLVYAQCLAGVIAKLPVVWPHVLATSMAQLSDMWSQAFGSSASLDCMIKPIAANHASVDESGLKALLTLLSPVFVLVCVLLLKSVWWACHRQLILAFATLSLWLLQLRPGCNDCVSSIALPAVGLTDKFQRWCIQQQFLGSKKGGGRRGLPTLQQYLRQRWGVMLVVMVFIFYPSVVRVAANMLTCVSVPTCGMRFWVMDVDKSCPLDDPWSVHGAWALAVGTPALLFCVAVPLFVAWLLFKAAQTHTLNDPVFEQRFGFLYLDYKQQLEDDSHMASITEQNGTLCAAPQCRPATWGVMRPRLVLAWDAVVHCLTAILVVISVRGLVLHVYHQAMLLSGALGAYLILIMWLRPFRCVHTQRLQELTVVVLIVTCQISLLLVAPDSMDTTQHTRYEQARPVIGALLLALNVAFVGVALFLFVRCLLRQLGKHKVAAAFHVVASQPASQPPTHHLHESPPESPACTVEVRGEEQQPLVAPQPLRQSVDFSRGGPKPSRRSSFSYSPAEFQIRMQAASQAAAAAVAAATAAARAPSAELPQPSLPQPQPQPQPQPPAQPVERPRPPQTQAPTAARSTARRPGPSRRSTFRL